MKLVRSKEFLDQFLAGHELSYKEFRELITLDEDLYLELKSGKLTDYKKGEGSKKRECAETIREYVSGFANAEGGLLVVGVSNDRPRKVEPCARHGDQSLTAWAMDFLVDMAPYLSPSPRAFPQETDDGDVLLIATPRSVSLVPRVEARQLHHHFRIGDKTIEAPEYLLSDLKLGRRSHPILSLIPTGSDSHIDNGWCSFSFDLQIENISLVSAENIIVGVICWDGQKISSNLNRHLELYFDQVITDELQKSNGPFYLTHQSAGGYIESPTAVRPFGRPETVSVGSFSLPASTNMETRWRASAAAYILPLGHPPTWFQLDFLLAQHIWDGYKIFELKVQQSHGDRPKVELRKEDRKKK